MPENVAAQHLRGVIDRLKTQFVGRDEVIDLIALALVAGEHLFLLGQPGTAKSALIRQFAAGVSGRYFEYMLTPSPNRRKYSDRSILPGSAKASWPL